MPDKVPIKGIGNSDIYYIYSKVGEEIPLRSYEVFHIPALDFAEQENFIVIIAL
ncbi:hypothetical protein [Clostridium omnivorum]|uniref:Uncharacterized protein n=1 Tax=Clostridium omnivorum TaxID=1604902 RepID=A0ABQ5N7X6_9CLOT|nr:hypothetical protein [Clostridium sp. E14]GLC31135.1 hypothetical protein bsdE14_25450 [Clostridium sp. E14]